MVVVSVIGISLVASASAPGSSVKACVGKVDQVIEVRDVCFDNEYAITLPSNPLVSPTPQDSPNGPIVSSPLPTFSSSPSENVQPTVTPTFSPIPIPSDQSQNNQFFKKTYLCGEDGKSLCKVGELGPGGGTIFFVDYNLEHESFDYLEAAPYSCIAKIPLVDINMSKVKSLQTTKAKQIGSGQRNTELLAKLSKSGPADYASSLSNSTSNLSAGCKRSLNAFSVTASDWFLPSSSELGLLLGNLRFQNPLGHAFYISSTMVHKDEVTAGQGYRDHYNYHFAINSYDMSLWQNTMGFEHESTSTWPIRTF
jgi:hypothetical protein